MRMRGVQLTMRRTMVVIACIGAGFAACRFHLLRIDTIFGFGTVYAERYTEAGFDSLRVGMSRTEVEAVMGPPLKKVSWFGDDPAVTGGDECWYYSEQPIRDGNYWRRWVKFTNGKITAFDSRFYVD